MTYRQKCEILRSNESICRILFSSSGCSQSISMSPRNRQGIELSKLVWVWKSVTFRFGVAIAAVEISPTKDRHISRPSGRFVDSNCLQHNRRSSPSAMVKKGSLSLYTTHTLHTTHTHTHTHTHYAHTVYTHNSAEKAALIIPG